MQGRSIFAEFADLNRAKGRYWVRTSCFIGLPQQISECSVSDVHGHGFS
jgi:hypothetical protein